MHSGDPMPLDYVINKDGTPGKRWNPITGCKKQLDICPIWEKCWARKRYKRFGFDFSPQIHLDRLHQPIKRKKHTGYYVSYVGDAFGDWVSDWWIEKVIQIIQKAPRHRYMFLTKRPGRYNDFIFPDNIWLGTSINTNMDFGRTVTLHESTKLQNKVNTYWEIEPALEDVSEKILALDEDQLPDWVIIGGWSGSDNEDLRDIITSITATLTQLVVPVWHKDNLPYGFLKENMLWGNASSL